MGVRDAHTGERLGVVADLSRGGLKLVGELRLEAETTRTLVVEVGTAFPDLGELELEAEVRWHRSIEPAGTWQHGFQFVQPLPRDTERALSTLLLRLED